MILTTAMLTEQLIQYRDPAGKILRLTREKKLFPLCRGIYETDPAVPGYCLAPVLYGPSYISFDYALAQYGLIPEAVYTYTSATVGKKKEKRYENDFGVFTYRDVPADVYPLGVTVREENGYVYRIATPEKALCDKLYTLPPVHSLKELRRLLFEDLRIDEQEFAKLAKHELRLLCGGYHANNLKCLGKMIGGNTHEQHP